MAKVKIQGHASGTGVLTVTAPNTSTDRTITLPDATGTLLNSDGSGANLTSLPAQSFSGLTDTTVSTTDPTISTNPSATGHLWINKTSGEQYVCTTNTSGANVWTNIGGGSGNVAPYSFDASSPFETGDGADGAISGTLPAQVYTNITNSSISAGANSCTVGSATGFATGNQVMVVQARKNSALTNATHEMLQISGISGTTITFASNFQNAYVGKDANTNNTIVLLQVKRYTDVTISNAHTVPAWDGDSGGYLVFKATGTVSITAAVSATARGFRGGSSGSVGNGNPTQQGEGNIGGLTNSHSNSGCAGGGGRQNVPSVASAKYGAGGSHGTLGQDGNDYATKGAVWGNQDLTTHLGHGGGGGAGGYDYSQAGGRGGYGGGSIAIMCGTLTISGSGSIKADGETGQAGAVRGGAGAGGSIYIKATTLTTNGQITADGTSTTDGASSGNGRIHFQVTGTTTGGASPTAYTG